MNRPMIAAPMRNTGLRRSRFHALAASETPAVSGEAVDLFLLGDSECHCAHLVLMRGSMSAYERSTSRLTTT